MDTEHRALQRTGTSNCTAAEPNFAVSGTGHSGRLPVLFSRDHIATVWTVVAVLLALMLRWVQLGRQSLWFDEGLTVWAAGLSPADIVRYAHSDSAPPLYFLLQHYWDTLFGNSETALRGLSALFGTLSLPVFYLLAKKMLKDSMAVALAMWLFAFSVMQVWYSREARFYQLCSLLALIGLYALILFLERRSVTPFATVLLSTTAIIYTHNMMFFYVLGLNVVWLAYPSERSWRQRIKEVLLADLIVGLFYLPWLPSLYSQVVVHKSFWAPRPTLSDLFHTWTLITGFYPDYLAAFAGRMLPLSRHTLLICASAFVIVLSAVLVFAGLWRVPQQDRRSNLALLMYCLVPPLAVFVQSRISIPLYGDRLFTNSSAVFPIILALPLALQKGRKGRIFFGGLAIILAVATALSAFGYLRYQQKENWRGAMNTLFGIPGTNRLVVFNSFVGECLFDYYGQRFPAVRAGLAHMGLPVDFAEQFPPPQRREMDSNDIERLKRAVELSNFSEVDLVLSHETYDDPNNLVADYLQKVFERQEEQRFYRVRILRFLRDPIRLAR